MARRPSARAPLIWAALAGSASVVYACSHPWDDYYPSSASASGSSSSSSSSGGGDGGPCTPGTTQACYTGSPATRNVGICKDGIAVCSSTQAWGPCTGDVTPKLEDCTTPEDDDCDGTANSHCGVWGYAFAATSGQAAYTMAVTPAGHVVVAGAANGKLASGGDAGALNDMGSGVFTVALDSPADPTSARFLGGASSAFTAVALDTGGGTLLGGAVYFNNQAIALPGLTPIKNTSTAGEWDFFLGRAQMGNGVWQMVLDAVPSGESAYVNAVALGAASTGYAAGVFAGTVDVGDAGADAGSADAGGGADAGDAGTDAGYFAKTSGALILKVDLGSGAVLWSNAFGQQATAYTVAPGAAGGQVLVGGAYSEGMLKLAPKTTLSGGAGLVAGMLIELDDTTGTPLRARGYPTDGAGSTVRLDSIAVDQKAGEVVAVGRFGGTVDFGAPPVDLVADAGPPDGGGPGCVPKTATGPADVFVTRLEIADLSCRWVMTFGNGSGLNGPGYLSSGFNLRNQSFGPQVAVDPSGAALVAANYAGTLQVDTTWSLTAKGTYAVALMKLDAGGNIAWIRSFGGPSAYATALGVDGTGDAYLAGQFLDKLEIQPGYELISPVGNAHEAVFVARIAH